MQVHNFRDLKVWQLSIVAVVDIYKVTLEFPNEEKFGLISQIRRCAVSIPSNIAEGSGRGSNKDFARFLGIALASSYELETQLIISSRLGIMSINSLNFVTEKLQEIQKIIFSLQRKFSQE
jgi:four helix bundle protein